MYCFCGLKNGIYTRRWGTPGGGGHPAVGHPTRFTMHRRGPWGLDYLFKYPPTYFKFKCHSALHNADSPPVTANVNNWTTYVPLNLTVIPQGVIVSIHGTRCDGVPNCWNKIDENNCGFSKLITVLIGNLFTVHSS